jgi:hypothetical protein
VSVIDDSVASSDVGEAERLLRQVLSPLGRFAADYRAEYGELPRTTLQR